MFTTLRTLYYYLKKLIIHSFIDTKKIPKYLHLYRDSNKRFPGHYPSLTIAISSKDLCN